LEWIVWSFEKGDGESSSWEFWLNIPFQTEMRARDAQILNNLKTIEEELNIVKQTATT
jgi:hypothetical protein